MQYDSTHYINLWQIQIKVPPIMTYKKRSITHNYSFLTQQVANDGSHITGTFSVNTSYLTLVSVDTFVDEL